MNKQRKFLICFFILTAIIFIISIWAFLLLKNRSGNSPTAEILLDGSSVRTLELSEFTEENSISFDIDGKNTIQVKDGRISVIYADCPDKVCVHQGERGIGCADASPIVCMPNKLSIIIHSGAAPDAVTQ